MHSRLCVCSSAVGAHSHNGIAAAGAAGVGISAGPGNPNAPQPGDVVRPKMARVLLDDVLFFMHRSRRYRKTELAYRAGLLYGLSKEQLAVQAQAHTELKRQLGLTDSSSTAAAASSMSGQGSDHLVAPMDTGSSTNSAGPQASNA